MRPIPPLSKGGFCGRDQRNRNGVGRGSPTPPECLTEGLMISRTVPIADSPGPRPTGRPSVAATAGSETRAEPRAEPKPISGSYSQPVPKFVSRPPQVSASYPMQRANGKSSHKMMRE